MTTIHQGDQYAVPITVYRDGQTQTSANIDSLEVVFAGIRKMYPGEIIFNDATSEFLFPLNQEETLKLESGSYDVVGRSKFIDGTIEGWYSMNSVSVVEMEGVSAI